MARSILHLLAHPSLHRSRVNRPLADAVRGLDGVTFVDLYAQYPDFDIDVAEQQRLLVAHDIVVFQHPFFWYSSPAILKEWQDLVLEFGFAYGDGGNALEGKALLSVISSGGGGDAYQATGHNRYTMTELLRPFEQTARLCGMDYLPPIVLHGTHGIARTEIDAHAAAVASRYRELLDEHVALPRGLA